MGPYCSQIVYKEKRQLIIAENILCATALMEFQPKTDFSYFIADRKQNRFSHFRILKKTTQQRADYGRVE